MPIDYIVPLVLFSLWLIAVCHSFLSKTATRLVPFYALVISIVMIPMASMVLEPYYGTEYEDAFVFQADSLDPTLHSTIHDPFRVQIEEYVVEDQEMGLRSYTGHFTTFSSVVWLANTFSPKIRYSANYTNFLASVLLALIVFRLALLITADRPISLLSVVLLASTPVLNVFHVSGLS